jgi:hypothetical protein
MEQAQIQDQEGEDGDMVDMVVAVARKESALGPDHHDGQNKRSLLFFLACYLFALAAVGGGVAAAILINNRSS